MGICINVHSICIYYIFVCCPVSVKFKEIAALSFSKRVSSNIFHLALLRRQHKTKKLNILEFLNFKFTYIRVRKGLLNEIRMLSPGFDCVHFN